MKSPLLFSILAGLLLLASALFIQCSCDDDDDDNDDSGSGNWIMCEHLCERLLACNLGDMIGLDPGDQEACAAGCTNEKPMEALECGLASGNCNDLEACLAALGGGIFDDDNDTDPGSVIDDDDDVVCDQERFDLHVEFACVTGVASYAGEYDTEAQCADACPEDYSFDEVCNWCFCCPAGK